MAKVKTKSLIVACISFVVLLGGTSKAANAADVQGEPAQIKVFALQNSAARDVLDVIDSIFGEETLRFAADERTNMVVVKGRPDTLAEVEAVLVRLDEAQAAGQQRVAQPRIKARLRVAPPREGVELRSQVQGTAVIRFLVPAGTKVTKGDLLVQLDDSTLIPGMEMLRTEIEVVTAEIAALQNAADAVGDLETAEAELKLARLRRTHFDAESKLELLAAESEITVAAAALEFAQSEHTRLEQLAQSGQINTGEVPAAAFEMMKARSEYELAKAQKALRVEHTRPLRLAELELEVQQHEWNLEQARREVEAQRAQRQKERRLLEFQLNIKSRELARLKDQIDKCKILAPVNGTVRYAGPRGKDGAAMIEEGAVVREGQSLMLLEMDSKAETQ